MTCRNALSKRKLQKAIKLRRKQLKNEYYKDVAAKINLAAEARAVEKEFALANKFTVLKSKFSPAISKAKLKTHFEKHFRLGELVIPPELAHPNEYPHLRDEIVAINEEIPDEQEVQEVIKSFKNNKGAGTDKLKTESLKYKYSRKWR